MSKTSFPHPSAPTIPRASATTTTEHVACVCRQPVVTSDMLQCLECKDMFHGSCVGVSEDAPEYVCQECVHVDPRRRRTPGTILGTGRSGAAGTPNGFEPIRNISAATTGISTLSQSAASSNNDDAQSLDITSTTLRASFAADMDDDDICPICEDECTCANNEYTTSSGFTGDNRAPDRSSNGPATYQVIGPTHEPNLVKSKSTQRSRSGPKKLRKQKASAPTDRSLISRLVSTMDQKFATDLLAISDDEDAEELLDDNDLQGLAANDAGFSSSDEDLDDSAFASVANTDLNSHAASVALAQAVQVAKMKKRNGGPLRPENIKKMSAMSPKNRRQQQKAAAPSHAHAVDARPTMIDGSVAANRGRDVRSLSRKQSVALPVAALTTKLDEEEEEFINITDVTSDEASAGLASDAEFDQHAGMHIGRDMVALAESDDAQILGDEDEDIEMEDAAYLAHMKESGYSTSSLSDVDDGRIGMISGSIKSDSELDSGAESDSESSSNADSMAARRHARRQLKGRRRKYRAYTSGSIQNRSESEAETDQELTFRAAQTEREHALVEYSKASGDHEDALLEMHLDQLRAVHSVIQDCPAPLLEHAAAASASDESSDMDREIVFTYQPQTCGSSDEFSNDIFEDWATESRMRRGRGSESADSDSSMSNAAVNRMLVQEDNDRRSLSYSSDSYDEFYTRSAFLDMGSDDIGNPTDGDDNDIYGSGLDLNSASLALGVALSMEQQGYSKEDAAAAAAVAAAAYPNTRPGNNRSSAETLGDHAPTTTITASMNSNGEADPIDGIVSIKSSTPRVSSSRMATGTHTPFMNSDWRMAAAAAAAAYLDASKPSATPYVLPKDLNEARSPSIALSTAVDSSTFGETVNTVGLSLPTTAVEAVENTDQSGISLDWGCEVKYGTELPAVTRAPSAPTLGSGLFASQLPNSSFYKPLSSIRSPAKGATVTAAPTISQGDTASALPNIQTDQPFEINTAENVATGPVDKSTISASGEHTGLKRKAENDDLNADEGIGSDVEDKRMRRESQLDTNPLYESSALDLSALFELDGTQTASPVTAAGVGTLMRGRHSYGTWREKGDDDDDWMLTMDQLVDTDALLTKSPPPSPVEGANAVSDAFSHSSPGSGRGQIVSAAGGSDPFARWDRIPINIFRRSRALASSNRRLMSSQDDSIGGMSSLAMSAIKSSRQRRALVSSTLLTQHTLPAEAALQQHSMRLALRQERRGMRRVQSSTATAGALGLHMPPPSTPLSAQATLQIAAMTDRGSASGSVSPSAMYRSSNHTAAAATKRRSRALDFTRKPIPADRSVLKSTRVGELRGRHRKLVSNGIVTDVGTPCGSSSQASDCSESPAGTTSAMNLASGNSVDFHADDGGHESESVYAFDWLEDAEDLGLFAMPGINPANDIQQQQQPSMTMVLASSSPMLMPFKTGSDAGSESRR
ncbi:hypothetical protein COEREDRAFT_89095 [Coemansia reversa NRRL 1564]|uniref:Zinc finger PHD-type domain-containing protein n=1 Tax=Coemansia reversa (strain ATCC 12441 / NRRL 1564) TaxID=763665 RepID=A0A2G5B4P8_COERN|nr:hypothetical protein COEREDRAFT_89095 [Coemansia reversa NRRL 1564]|eukprot:PIA14023.1 hypothetical protein COEREDRAFT_89095 [Coemansia reversa NRRL 1564]